MMLLTGVCNTLLTKYQVIILLKLEDIPHRQPLAL